MRKFLEVKWTSYERLEFYGDAVLGFVASKMLFEESDTDGPHELTIKRQKMVFSSFFLSSFLFFPNSLQIG